MLHSPLGTFPETYKKLWVSFRDQNEIGLEYLSGYWNGSMVIDRFNHKVMARQDGHGLCSIDSLDPDLTSLAASDAYYYHDMIKYLISIGYEVGKTLFGFPYDWRQSVRHGPTLEKLHDLIHRLHNTTFAPGGFSDEERQPVDIMTHSMGGLLMKSYVSKYLEDSAGVLGKWTAIGAPWRGGGSVAYKAMISGYALDMVTVPVVDWGLREDVAHAMELNWPSAFELLPDVYHDIYKRSDPSPSIPPPSVTYQLIGGNPISTNTPAEVLQLLTDVNVANMQVWMKGQPAVPNPLNQGAWKQAQGTHGELHHLTDRLDELRQSRGTDLIGRRNNGGLNPSPVTLTVNSIDGSQVPTKYSLSFNTPIANVTALQRATPSYSLVGGDGTVPYASSSNDGLFAEHYDYPGKSDHQRLLRTPEVMVGARRGLNMDCPIEGTWKVNIYTPSGEVFATQYWTFKNESGVVPVTRLLSTTTVTSFNTTFDDGTRIFGQLAPDCLTFVGTWYTTYRTQASRIIGNDCTPHEVSRSTVNNGTMVHTCIYGNWSSAGTLFCGTGTHLSPSNTSCIPIPQPETSHSTRNAIIIGCSIAGVLLAAIGIGFIVHKLVNKKKESTPYRRINMDDEEEDDFSPSGPNSLLDA